MKNLILALFLITPVFAQDDDTNQVTSNETQFVPIPLPTDTATDPFPTITTEDGTTYYITTIGGDTTISK